MKILPSRGVVILKPVTHDTTTSGLLIPDQDPDKRPQIGTVYTVGKPAKDTEGYPLVLKVGDRVIYKKWGGSNFTVHGEEFVSVDLCELIGVVVL